MEETINHQGVFLGIITLGYFGIKIVNGLFQNRMPKQTPIAEMPNFTALIVMSLLLYYFTNFGQKNSLNWFFLFGFLSGLAFSPLIGILDQLKIRGIDYIFYGILIIVGIVLLLLNFSYVEKPLYYAVYLIAILTVVLGLILTRKKKTLTMRSNEKVIETAGTEISLHRGMVAWLLALLFVGRGEGLMGDLMFLVNGILIGIFVSDSSLNGVKYFLSDDGKSKEKNMECLEGQVQGKEYVNLTEAYDTLKWVVSLTLMIVMIMVIVFFFFSA